MNIEQYLRGKIDYEITDATMASILFDRGISANTSVENTTEKQRDLCLADLYVFVSRSSISTSGEYESDGGWQKKKASKTINNRGGYVRLAKALYEKWGVTPPANPGSIVMKPIY